MNWESLTPKDIVRPLLVLMLVGTMCYLAIINKVTVTQQDIKELTLMAFTFYFTVKAMGNNKKE